jgi:hypothetical protein
MRSRNATHWTEALGNSVVCVNRTLGEHMTLKKRQFCSVSLKNDSVERGEQNSKPTDSVAEKSKIKQSTV